MENIYTILDSLNKSTSDETVYTEVNEGTIPRKTPPEHGFSADPSLKTHTGTLVYTVANQRDLRMLIGSADKRNMRTAPIAGDPHSVKIAGNAHESLISSMQNLGVGGVAQHEANYDTTESVNEGKNKVLSALQRYLNSASSDDGGIDIANAFKEIISMHTGDPVANELKKVLASSSVDAPDEMLGIAKEIVQQFGGKVKKKKGPMDGWSQQEKDDYKKYWDDFSKKPADVTIGETEEYDTDDLDQIANGVAGRVIRMIERKHPDAISGHGSEAIWQEAYQRAVSMLNRGEDPESGINRVYHETLGATGTIEEDLGTEAVHPGAMILVNGQWYVIDNIDGQTIWASDKDGQEYEIDPRDIESIEESQVEEDNSRVQTMGNKVVVTDQQGNRTEYDDPQMAQQAADAIRQQESKEMNYDKEFEKIMESLNEDITVTQSDPASPDSPVVSVTSNVDNIDALQSLLSNAGLGTASNGGTMEPYAPEVDPMAGDMSGGPVMGMGDTSMAGPTDLPAMDEPTMDIEPMDTELDTMGDDDMAVMSLAFKDEPEMDMEPEIDMEPEVEPPMEDRDIEHANTPNEELGTTDTLVNKMSGGLNGQKRQYDKGYEGDNIRAVREGEALDETESFFNLYKEFQMRGEKR